MKRTIILILFILTSFIIVFYLSIYPLIKSDYVICVPNVVDLDESSASNILRDNNINFEIIYVKSGKQGEVVKTNPTANSLIKPHQRVLVYVSNQEDDKVIDFTGMDMDYAVDILENYKKKYNIDYTISYVYSDSGIDNQVVFQSIKDVALNDITNINIKINRVKNDIIMPDFTNMNIKEALDFCQKNGFVLDTIFISSYKDRFVILYQDVNPGSKIYKNSQEHLLFYVAK